jgi:hypothetical protein
VARWRDGAGRHRRSLKEIKVSKKNKSKEKKHTWARDAWSRALPLQLLQLLLLEPFKGIVVAVITSIVI